MARFPPAAATAIVALLLCASAHSLPIVRVSGTPYEVGRGVGTQMRDTIQSYVAAWPIVQDKILPFVATADGEKAFNAFRSASAAAYPDIAEEIRGLGDGSGLNDTVVWAVQLATELQAMITGRGPSLALKACTDVHANYPGAKALAHNEDARPQCKSAAYLVDATVNSTINGVYRFLAFTYPAQIPGNAYAWLYDSQMAVTCNALFPNITVRPGIGRNFITRDLLASRDIKDAVRRSTVDGRAYGFSVNLASVASDTLYNLEMSPASYALTEVPPNSSSRHMNMYLHLNFPQHEDPSSEHRLAASLKHPEPTSPAIALSILGDTSDPVYPIYRNATPPDSDSTASTVLFDFNGGNVAVFTTNPALTKPTYVFPMSG